MENFISLLIDSTDFHKKWYNIVKNTLVGNLSSYQIEDKISFMKKVSKNDKILYTIPLLRNITANEVNNIIDLVKNHTDEEFEVSSSMIETNMNQKVKVEVDYKPLLDICTGWAKTDHQVWMKEKLNDGWRYSPITSRKHKTHPLIRQWSDLPDEYKVVNVSKAEELLKLFNDSGYVMIHHTHLDQLNLNNNRTII